MENTTRLLRRRQVEALTGLRRSTIYDKMTCGQFPRPVRLGARAVAWVASEVEAWVQARIAASRTTAATTQP